MRGRFRRVIAGLLGLVAVVVLSVLGVGAWLSTASGRDFALAQLRTAVPGLVVVGADGSVFDLSVTRVTLADTDGVWLTVDNAHLAWNPWALLGGNVRIDNLSAASVQVTRAPKPQPGGTGDSNAAPSLPLAVTLTRLALEQVTLGPDLLGGAPALLTLTGQATLPAGVLGGTGSLEVRRIDDKPGSLTLSGDYRPGRRLMLSAQLSEPGNGLLADLLDIPGQPPVTLTLTGDGPLTEWTGRATAKAGAVADASGEFRIRPTGSKLSFGLDLTGNVQGLLPPTLRPLVGPDLRIGAGGLIDPGVQITLDGVGIQMAAGRLSGGGGFDLKTRALQVGAWADIADGALLSTLTAPMAFSAARGSITLTGTPQAPALATDLTLDRVNLPDLQLAALGIKVSAAGVDRTAVTANLHLTGAAGRLSALTGTAADLAADFTLRSAGGIIDVAKADFTTAALSGTASGSLSGWGQDGTLAVTLAARDLSPLSGLAGRKLSGSLTLDGKLNRQGGQTSLTVRGRGQDLTAGIAALDPFLVGGTELTGDATLGPDIRLHHLSLANPRLTVDGQGHYGPGGISADIAAVLPDLTPLTPVLGIEMAGAVKAQLKSDAAGTLRLDVTGDGLVLDGLHLVDTRVSAALTGVPTAMKGRVSLESSLNGQPIALGSDLSLREQELALPGIAAVIGLNRFSGDLSLNLGTALAAGQLTGTVPDLGILAFIAGDEVWGNGTAQLSLSRDKGRQSAAIKADFKDIWRRWHGQKVASLSLSGRLEGSPSAPSVDGDLTVTGVDAGTLDLDKVSAGAHGSLSALALSLDLSGKRGSAPLRLSMMGQLAAGAGPVRLGLTRLSGGFADAQFHLAGPADLSFGDGALGVRGLVLLADDARLTADADLTNRTLTGHLALTRLPLNWVRLINPTWTLYGRLDGIADLSGTVADPRGSLSLKLSEFALAPPVLKGPSPLGADLTANWQGGRVAVDARIDSAGAGVGLSGRVDLPLVLQGAVTRLAMPADQPISGRVRGDLALNRLNDLLASSGDRLGGQMAMDLNLGGSLADRQLTGTVTLTDASYENQRWGTQVKDIQALLKGDPQGLVIERFQGATPGGGTLSLAGRFGFHPELGDRQIDLHLTAKKARLAGIDMVQVVAGADLTLMGRPAEMLLAGRIDVADAHIRIPDKLPPTVVEVKVVEINHPRRYPPPGAVSSADAKAEGTPPPAIHIGLNVDVEAPNQIYLAGRGLDAELKASLKLRGSSDLPLLSGNVSLVKGEMGVLGQTFTLSRANATFLGDGTFDPELDMEASTQRGDLTAIVAVTGRPSRPSVKLSSQPPYPEDEVLARLLFNRGAGQLSALEAVQLAQSAGQLSGLFGGGPGFVDKVKRSLGVDRLEFRGSDDGSGAGTVAAGRYIGDKLYVGVEQELGTGQSKATVEYGVTDHIKARGEVGNESKVGVQFQWDY